MISYEKLVLKLKENGFSQYKLKQEQNIIKKQDQKNFKYHTK